MKKAKILSMVVVAVMVLSVLSACSGSGETSTSQTESETTEQVTEKSTDETESIGSGTSITKIAMLLPGVITDQSWNTTAYEGLMQLKDLGYETAYTENVQTVDIETAFRNYAQQGYNLIIGQGSQFGDAAIIVAEDFPDTYFFVYGKEASDVYPNNVGWVDSKTYEGSFMCGALAALMSESGIIGYVGGEESAGQLSMKNAYIQGAEYINEDIDVVYIMAGTFDDPALGKEAAMAQFEQGVDVIMQSADNTGLGVVEAAKEAGVYIMGYGSDQNHLAPELFLTSLLEVVQPVIVNQATLIENGEFGGVYRPDWAGEEVILADFGTAVPEAVITELNTLSDKIISGEVEIIESFEQ